MRVLLQYGLAFFWMCVVPLLSGGIFAKVLVKNRRFLVVSAMSCGLVLNYAVYQVIAMGFVLADGSFRLLTWIYAAISLTLAVAGGFLWYICLFGKKAVLNKEEKEQEKVRFYKDPYFIMGAVFVIVQVVVILVMATPDKDDAYYTGLSSMCIANDYVLKYSAYDGAMTMPIETRYVMAALPVYQASLSILCKGLHTLIICHNFYPLFYMPLAYGLNFFSFSYFFICLEIIMCLARRTF